MTKTRTDEGLQEMRDRAEVAPGELAIETGHAAADRRTAVIDPWGMVDEDETMIINMGPQHPSTHGVLRLMLELQGETILRCKPIIGYLHTGMEKTGETLAYFQGCTNTTRMDYLSPFANELVFSLATEKLLGIEAPPRATYIRMLMCELNRITSHLFSIATQSQDLGGMALIFYGLRERDVLLRFFEKATGLRMNHNYIRPGGVACDLPEGWRDDIAGFVADLPSKFDEYEGILSSNPIWLERTVGVGVIDTATCISLGITGPILRATGCEWDLRRAQPALPYFEFEWDVITGEQGDVYDRYLCRLNEMRESVRLIEQIADAMPAGDWRVQDKKVTPPPRSRIDESMEALIHHFKLFTEGFTVPPGEIYLPVESPRGELGCYMVSDGSSRPYRMHIRGPSFVNLQALAPMMENALIADTVAAIASCDPVMGEVDR